MGRRRLQPEMTDKRICEIKDQRTEITQSEQQRENTKNNNDNKPKGPKQKTEHSSPPLQQEKRKSVGLQKDSNK